MPKNPKPPTPANLSLDRINQHFGTDEAARSYLEAVRWPNGPLCAHCGNNGRIWKIEANTKRKVRPGLYECGHCHKQFTVTVGTIFEDSKIPLRKWLVAWYMVCSSKKGVAALQIQRQLEIGSYRSAWFMLHRIRYALRHPEFQVQDKLTGTVEADESWIGGKRTGPGAGYKKNKTAVVSLVERGGRVRSTAMKDHHVTSANLREVLTKHVAEEATLMTDELNAYRAIDRGFAKHEVVNHSREEYVRGEAHTNSVEGYFGNLKRGINGIYHHVGRKYLNQYLAEFDFRYNEREVSDGTRTVTGIKKVEGKRLTLRTPKGIAEVLMGN